MTVFVDTSYLLALALETDELHDRALRWHAALRAAVVTTEYVLVELADSLVRATLRRLAIESIRVARAAPGVRVVEAGSAWLDAGLVLYSSRPDKDWGLTDCISFAVMQRMQIADALTSDRHFEQAGFRALLRHEPPASG
jgi:predicted nucleic acid-binding protein